MLRDDQCFGISSFPNSTLTGGASASEDLANLPTPCIGRVTQGFERDFTLRNRFAKPTNLLTVLRECLGGLPIHRLSIHIEQTEGLTGST